MILTDIFRLLTPYTASSSYTLPELATIAFERDRAFASDGISSISVSLSGTPPRDVCVKAAPVSAWLNTLGTEGVVLSGVVDRKLELSHTNHISEAPSAECSFATSPLSSYRVAVPDKLWGQVVCKVEDTLELAAALSYVLKRSGTDSTFQWASGVTLAFSHGTLRAYMTDNITMAISTCPVQSQYLQQTVMITHGAAQRLQALMASVPGSATFSFEEGRLMVQVGEAVFSTVTVADSAELSNFLQHVEPFSELETFEPSPGFISSVQRHGQFAGREGEGTRIRVRDNVATLFTSSDGGRIKDRVELLHPDIEVFTGASVLARMLGDGSTVRLTEEAVLTVDDATGNCALLCAWDDTEVA